MANNYFERIRQVHAETVRGREKPKGGAPPASAYKDDGTGVGREPEPDALTHIGPHAAEVIAMMGNGCGDGMLVIQRSDGQRLAATLKHDKLRKVNR